MEPNWLPLRRGQNNTMSVSDYVLDLLLPHRHARNKVPLLTPGRAGGNCPITQHEERR
jgi:hypothetical protein